MIRRFLNPLTIVVAVAVGAGAKVGEASAAESEPGFPQQCYSSDGSNSCDYCGGVCLGGEYLCCVAGAE